MKMKGAGVGEGFERIDTWSGGFGWLAHPDELMQRASHALATDDGVWLVDPVDAAGLDDELAELGTVEGVVLCLDRHKRDAAAIANRHDVAVHLPSTMRSVANGLDAMTVLETRELADTGYEIIPVIDRPFWREIALYHPENRTLYVSETVGKNEYYTTASEVMGVHPALRLLPPRRPFETVEPDRILVGHGTGVHADADAVLRSALANSRRNAPALYLKSLRGALSR